MTHTSVRHSPKWTWYCAPGGETSLYFRGGEHITMFPITGSLCSHTAPRVPQRAHVYDESIHSISSTEGKKERNWAEVKVKKLKKNKNTPGCSWRKSAIIKHHWNQRDKLVTTSAPLISMWFSHDLVRKESTTQASKSLTWAGRGCFCGVHCWLLFKTLPLDSPA